MSGECAFGMRRRAGGVACRRDGSGGVWRVVCCLVAFGTKKRGDARLVASVVWVWPLEERLGRGGRDEEKECVI